MSTSSLGIPIPIGIIHGFHNDNTTYSLLANCIPPTILLKYDKPLLLNNINELDSLDKSNIDYGSGYYITNKMSGAITTNQYIYNQYDDEFTLLNNPINKEYLNIYALYQGEKLSSYDFFMRININNIRSNIKIISLLDSNFAIHSNEFFSLLGTIGKDSLDNSISNNVISPLLYVNIRNGLNVILKLLLSIYDIRIDNTEFNYSKFYNSIIDSVNEILKNNMSTFINLFNEGINIDTSIFLNYIGASFASFRQIFSEYYLTNTLSTIINPNIPLALIDQPLINKISLNTIVASVFEEILYSINATLMNKYYPQLKSFIEYCMNKNNKIKNITSTRSTFLEDICEGIGGVVLLALFFSIFSNGDSLSRTTLYLHFVAPKKFSGFY